MSYRMSMILSSLSFVQIEVMMLSGVQAGGQVGLRGVAGGAERVSQKDASQGVEDVDAVLPGGGDIAADTTEVHEGVKATEGSGDLLPQLHHSQITLREVVVELCLFHSLYETGISVTMAQLWI